MISNGLLIAMSRLGIETPYRYKLRQYWLWQKLEVWED
jgi:hypothetical protein